MNYYPNKKEVDVVLDYLKNKFEVKAMNNMIWFSANDKKIKYIILSEKPLYFNVPFFNSKKLAKYKILLEIKDDEQLKDISDSSLFKGIKDYINSFD